MLDTALITYTFLIKQARGPH